jgi:nucleoid DNA-binding protein
LYYSHDKKLSIHRQYNPEDPRMSKAILIGAVRRAAPGLTPKEAKQVVVAILATIVEELEKQGSFSLHEIGALSLQHKAARRGRNPLTGARLIIKPRTAIRFRGSSVLLERLNGRLMDAQLDVRDVRSGLAAVAEEARP